MSFDPNFERKAAFEALFARETVTRSSQTFNGVTNHDGVIITVNPFSKGKASRAASSSRKPSASAARQALIAQIHVTVI